MNSGIMAEERVTLCPELRTEESWQRAKEMYMKSVIEHTESRRAGNDVMTELHHLMNAVAGQRYGHQSGRDGTHWQHPADLTRRNYCVRGRLLSLSEWQKRNHLDFKRFVKVPDIFHRSAVL
ncbi:S100P-binding protein-like isoform X2 [Triplophysa dalaica]|uniref:S100P-binding protein-like isoform X2 n=1 Tax=Triplophysa dalaica TaxID=1582913 RepID=UPI0024DF8446|nr:S100P-binding protein-like isoform X2 [Triplophysa dalaica]